MTEEDGKMWSPSSPLNISLACAKYDVCLTQQLGSHLSSPALSDDEQMAAAGCHSSGWTATTLAADKLAGQDLPGELGLAWTSTESKIPELACCVRGDRKAANSQSFAKHVRENSRESLHLLHHAASLIV